jgi:hypothetical protein
MRNAAVMCGALRRVMPGIPPERAMSACVLLCDFAGSVTRLSTELETDAERRLEQEAKVMMADYLTNLFRSQLGK